MKTKSLALFSLALLVGCPNYDDDSYKRYSLTSIYFVPDSLKAAHREFIIEATRAASQHMTGGEYEEVDKTIEQAEETADRVFQTKVIGLKLEGHTDGNWYYEYIRPENFTPTEKHIFDSLYSLRR